MYGADGKRVDGSTWIRAREKAMNRLLVIDKVFWLFCRDLLHRRREQVHAACCRAHYVPRIPSRAP